MPDRFADTPQPPYVAAIFTSQLRDRTDGEYQATASALVRRIQEAPGFLGFEAASDPTGFEMVVAYFADESSLSAWKNDEKHVAAQRNGKERWYSHYRVRVARVEHSYSGPGGR